MSLKKPHTSEPADEPKVSYPPSLQSGEGMKWGRRAKILSASGLGVLVLGAIGLVVGSRWRLDNLLAELEVPANERYGNCWTQTQDFCDTIANDSSNCHFYASEEGTLSTYDLFDCTYLADLKDQCFNEAENTLPACLEQNEMQECAYKKWQCDEAQSHLEDEPLGIIKGLIATPIYTGCLEDARDCYQAVANTCY